MVVAWPVAATRTTNETNVRPKAAIARGLDPPPERRHSKTADTRRELAAVYNTIICGTQQA